MSRLENLKKNDWIVLTEVKPVEFPSHIPGIDHQLSYPYCCNGIPLKVLAINAPWVVVDDGRFKGTIDTRFVSWTKASLEYRKSLTSIPLKAASENYKNLWYVSENDTEEDKPKLCPNCQEPIVMKKDYRKGWMLVCNNCKFQGELPSE